MPLQPTQSKTCCEQCQLCIHVATMEDRVFPSKAQGRGVIYLTLQLQTRNSTVFWFVIHDITVAYLEMAFWPLALGHHAPLVEWSYIIVRRH